MMDLVRTDRITKESFVYMEPQDASEQYLKWGNYFYPCNEEGFFCGGGVSASQVNILNPLPLYWGTEMDGDTEYSVCRHLENKYLLATIRKRDMFMGLNNGVLQITTLEDVEIQRKMNTSFKVSQYIMSWFKAEVTLSAGVLQKLKDLAETKIFTRGILDVCVVRVRVQEE